MKTIHAGLLVCVLMKLVEAVPLASFYTFGPSAGDTSLPRNDDDFSSLISLSTEFSYFGTNHDAVYVNNNGVVSFDAPVSTFTPEAFPINGSRVLLSPYWADVDTRPSNGGFVYYRQSTDSILLTKATNQVHTLFPAFSNFTPTFLFIATWDHVGYFAQNTDKTNTFQCVMITDGTNSFVAFLYADGLIQWTTGDASGGSNGFGGTPAQGGFNAGDGIRFFSINDSQTAAIVNIETTSNVGVPGLWMFRVDQNALSTPSAPPDIDECALGTHGCSPNADCIDTMENYTCICRSGFTGDGITCTVVLINECALGLDNCDFHAVCTDTNTSFECTCPSGYSGDGRICTGEGDIRFSLNGTTYENNSIVMLEDIGEGRNALDCLTDLTACCRPPYTNSVRSAMGNWFFPNGTRVPSSGQHWEIHRTRGHMKVLMQRRRGGVTGVYHCVIPDALNVTQTIYIGIYTATSLPMPPTNLRVTLINSTSVTISWQAPPPVSTVTIASYRLVVSETQFGLNDTVASSTTTSYTFTGLEEYNNYTCSVVAVSAYDVISTETAISFTTPQGDPTGVPQNVIAGAASSTSITLRWEAPLADLQNGIIRSYHISVVELETGRVRLFTTNNVDRLLVVNLLHPFYTYNCTIAAYTIGRGPSISVSVQTLQEEPSDVPRDIVVSAVDARSVQLSWVPPPPQHWNGIIIGYVIRVIGVHTDEDYHLPLTNSTSMVIENLHPFYTYRFFVAAQTVAVGPFSNPIALQMPEAAPSAGSVEQVTVDVVSSTSINVSWLPASQDNWNGVITHYTVEYKLIRSVRDNSGVAPTMYASIPALGQPLVNSPNPTLVTLPLKRESVLISGLHEFSVYQFTIYYENAVGRSDSSSPLEQATSAAAPSGPPTDVVATALSPTTVSVSWQPPALLDQNGVITAYQVVLVDTSDGSTKMSSVGGNTLTLLFEGLNEYTTFRVSVAANNSFGIGPYSQPMEVKTQESTPGRPTNLIRSIQDKTSVRLHWSKPNDPNGVILGYQVFYYGYKGNHTKSNQPIEILDEERSLTVGPNTTSVVINNLEPGLRYDFKVRAKTSIGYGANSSALTVTLSDAQTGSVTSGISGTTIIVVAIVGLVLLVILVLIVVVAVIYRMCRKRGKFKIDTRRTNTESNIYDTVPRLEFLNALTLESETPKKGVETEFGHATVEAAPKFDELCDKDTIEKTMPNAYFPEDMTCN